MKNVTQFPVSVQSAPHDVVVLSCAGRMQLDPAPLRHLFGHKPDHEAEEIICRMLEDIAQRLDVLQRGMAARNFEMMLRPVRRIALVASHIGLIEVVTAADHVHRCLIQKDGIALEATIARLERGFDIAVNEIWLFRDD